MKKNPSSRVTFFAGLSTAGLIVLLVAFWMQRAELARVRRAVGNLQEQNAELESNAAAGRVKSAPVAVAPRQVQEPAHRQETGAPQPEAAPHPVAEEPNRLALAETEILSTPDGLVATMRFSPSKTGPLGLVALVVRMPRNSDARILDLTPVGRATYTESNKELAENGKFAFFQGTLKPGDEKEVRFALKVSGPTTASMTGSCGLKPFELTIQAPPANGRKK